MSGLNYIFLIYNFKGCLKTLKSLCFTSGLIWTETQKLIPLAFEEKYASYPTIIAGALGSKPKIFGRSERRAHPTVRS